MHDIDSVIVNPITDASSKMSKLVSSVAPTQSITYSTHSSLAQANRNLEIVNQQLSNLNNINLLRSLKSHSNFFRQC